MLFGRREAEDYPNEQTKMAAFDERVEQHQAAQTDLEPEEMIDISTLTKVLSFTSLASLLLTVVLACNTMFFSTNITSYEINRDMFFTVAFVCTLIYFCSAYWATQRRKIASGIII